MTTKIHNQLIINLLTPQKWQDGGLENIEKGTDPQTVWTQVWKFYDKFVENLPALSSAWS
jgi:hypothetical protein